MSFATKDAPRDEKPVWYLGTRALLQGKHEWLYLRKSSLELEREWRKTKGNEGIEEVV